MRLTIELSERERVINLHEEVYERKRGREKERKREIRKRK